MLHVIGSRQYGGADQFFVRLVRALAAAGEQVLAVTRAGSPVARAVSEAGLPQRHLPLASKWDLYTRWRLGQLARRLGIDVVQSYMGRATRLTRLPATGRAVHVARLGGYYKVQGYYEHAHAWVGNTRGVCDHLMAAGLPRERVFLIGNFVDPPAPIAAGDLDKARADLGLPADAFVVFTLGRFIAIKGFDDLLRAFARLPPRVGDRPLFLVLAGAGPLASGLAALAGELGLGPRVKWPGWVDRPGPFYELADVFVCPSRHETLGNVILEAWSYRRAVLATDTLGATELVEDGRTGLVAPRADPEGLAARLRELLAAPPDRRLALGAAGHDRVVTRHGQAAIVSAYTGLYQRLLAERRGTGAGAGR
jgi:glycosyltransferase involved in cell wall biosynthesis